MKELLDLNQILKILKNLKNFLKEKGVEIYNYALSENDGEEDLHLPMDPNSEASASLSDFSKNYRFTTRKIKVKTIKLPDFLKKIKIKHIDLYISDIEGYDFIILKKYGERLLEFELN